MHMPTQRHKMLKKPQKIVDIRSLSCSKLNFDVVPTSCARLTINFMLRGHV